MTMEDFFNEKGVFLHTKYLDSELMIKCLQQLLADFPHFEFTSLSADKKYNGYRVHFSCPDEELVLAKKHITINKKDIQIYPLSAYLTVHNTSSRNFDKDIRNAITNKFGKLLYPESIPNSKDQQNGNTKAWHVCIDIPEIKELDIFDFGASSEMDLFLSDKKEKLKVTFCCRRCKEDGHFLQDCPQLSKISTEEQKSSNKSENVPVNSVKLLGISLEKPEAFAEKIGKEEVLKTGVTEKDDNGKICNAEPSISEKEANKSEENDSIPANWASVKIKDEFEIENESQSDTDIDSKNDEGENNIKEKPTKSADDEVQIIGIRENSNSSNTSHSIPIKSEKADAAYLEEASNSPTRSERSFAQISSGPSHQRAKPSTSVETTSNLSPQLQGCINDACQMFQILDRNKLDAFLIHVKKKSNPIRIACNYTSNPAGLKEQLQEIIKLFYNTPQAGTKDDTSFIKWLTGLVERFEGTVPKKRKRSDQNHSDLPNKK